MRAVEQKTIKRIQADAYNSEELQQLLCDAASKGWTNVVQELLSRGVDPNSRRYELSALTIASQMGRDHVDIVRLLLDAGAEPRDPDVVAECGVETLPVLLASGAPIDGRPKHRNPLLVAITMRTKQDKALALLAAGADPNVADEHGITALMHAATNGRDKVFDALLAAEADLYQVDPTGRSAVRYAIESICAATGATDSDRRLAKRICRLIRDQLPAQPEDAVLLEIVPGDHVALADRLRGGLDANSVIPGSIGILSISAETIVAELEQGEGIEAILNMHSIENLRNADAKSGGSTILMWAVLAGEYECVRTLLEAGADPQKANDAGVSAFTLSNASHVGARIRKLIHDATKRT